MRPNGTIARALLVGVSTVAALGCGSAAAPVKTSAPLPDDRAVARVSASLLTPFALVVQRSSVSARPGPLGGPELFLYAQPTRPQAAAVYAGRFQPLGTPVDIAA